MTAQWEPMFEELTAERYPRLLARALVLERDMAAAEDLVQEALIATFSKRRNFTHVAQAEQYVRRAISTRFINALQKSSREQDLWGRTEVAVVAESHADGVAANIDLAALLNELAPRERVCVALRFLDDASVRETAAVLNLSEGAVKRYVSDGLAKLNSRLGTDASLADTPRVDVLSTEGGAS